MPRAAPRGLDDYDANYRREVDEIQQGVAEGSDDFEVRLDGKTVPGPFNDFDHARNKASKLISYQKGEVAEVYVNGKLKMRLKLNTPHQHFDAHDELHQPPILRSPHQSSECRMHTRP